MGGESEPRRELVVVGAGAAGLWAAEAAARAGRDVLLLEKTRRTGTKVLASGGTRCNLTTTLGPDAAAELFGRRAARFLRPGFRALTPADVRERFAGWGVRTVEAPLEKVFPESGRARDVRDALEGAARRAGAEIRVGDGVRAVDARGSGPDAHWRVALVGGATVEAARLLLCPGGRSYASTGTTGDGYAWLEELGLAVVPPVPALTPLTSSAAWVRELTGIALQDVELRLVDVEGRTLGRRRRPLLFTHEGLSGPGPMDLSAQVARAHLADPDARHELRVDLLPGLDREQVRAALVEAARRPGGPGLARLLPGELPRRLGRAVLAAAGLDPELRAQALDRAGRHALVECLKGLAIPVDGTAGFDRAEVTAGGLALDEVDPVTMEVNGRPGLRVCGELLDVDGPIGGLNFQAAFATAEAAARSPGGGR